MLLEAKLSITLEVSYDQRSVAMVLKGNTFNRPDALNIEFARHLNLSTDMLYDRVQEHLNNALRLITNNLTQQLKKEKQHNVR